MKYLYKSLGYFYSAKIIHSTPSQKLLTARTLDRRLWLTRECWFTSAFGGHLLPSLGLLNFILHLCVPKCLTTYSVDLTSCQDNLLYPLTSLPLPDFSTPTMWPFHCWTMMKGFKWLCNQGSWPCCSTTYLLISIFSD